MLTKFINFHEKSKNSKILELMNVAFVLIWNRKILNRNKQKIILYFFVAI